MATLLRTGLLAASCGSLLAYVAFLFYAGTDSYQQQGLPWMGSAVSSLDGPTAFFVLCSWGALLAAALLVLALRRLPAAPRASAPASWALSLRRLLAWQLPPRAFLAGWCGGLSLAEALGVAGWLALNLCWLVLGLQRELEGADDLAVKLDGAARVLGQMIAPNLMLLFLPIPHTNILTWLTGVSRNRLIRFHRWLGHGTVLVIAAHGVLYYILWAKTHMLQRNFADWGTAGAVNNLAGSLAFFCVLALWLTSLDFVRRRFYELFFRCHLALFVAFVLLSAAHYPGWWLYFAPGLILYAADLALRAGQMSNATTVTAAAMEESGLATLLLRADKALRHRPLSEVWLLVPQLSRWQWHPFSVASGGGQTLKLHIKQYGRFTQGLLSALRQRRPLAVRVSGPLGNEETADCQLTPAPSWGRYPVVVMVCGGVGVTGMLSMLRSMVAQRASGSIEGLPRRVVCVWTARLPSEFAALDAPLLLAATSKAGWFTLHLHVTGSGSGGLHSAQHSTSEQETETQLLLSDEPHPPVRMPGASAFGWSLLRPVQPLSFGTLQLAAVFVLAFGGAFCAALLGASVLQEAALEQWKGGMLMCVLLGAMSTGLPFMLAVFPIHAWRYWRALQAVECLGPEAERTVAPYYDQAMLQHSSCTVKGSMVVAPGGGASIQAQPGRPDVAAALRSAAAEAGDGAVVGVFAGGPAGLMRSIHLTVCELNSEGGGAYFELHNESVEL